MAVVAVVIVVIRVLIAKELLRILVVQAVFLWPGVDVLVAFHVFCVFNGRPTDYVAAFILFAGRLVDFGARKRGSPTVVAL